MSYEILSPPPPHTPNSSILLFVLRKRWKTLLDHSGNIIGVVTSKLNALFVAKEIGDIPQGANFAIKSSIVRIFLDLNNVD